MIHFYGKNRPDQITIFGTLFRIEWFSDTDNFGEIDFEQLVIRIGKNVHPTLAVDTLIHEVFHGIWYFSSMGKAEKEEKSVSVLASGLNSVLAANPKLSEWLMEIHHE